LRLPHQPNSRAEAISDQSFEVAFPAGADPTITAIDVPSEAGPIATTLYRVHHRNVHYVVAWSALGGREANGAKAVINQMVTGIAGSIPSGRVVSDREIQQAGLAGREIVIEKPLDRSMLRERVFVVGSRAFQITLAWAPSNGDPLEAEAFFASFRAPA